MKVVRLERSHSSGQALASLGCFVGAGLAALFGAVLTTGSLFNAEVHPFIHGLGVTLLVVALPLLICGGHFLDVLERRQQSRSSGDRQSTHS